MKKKYLVTAVAMAAAISMMAACGSSGKNEENTTPTPTVTVAPTEAPDTKPEATATPAPTEAPEVDHNQMIQNVVQALKENYGPLYLPDMQMQEDEMYMKDILGLDSSWYDAAVAEVPGMSFGVDKFIMIHPTEGNLENVQNAITAFQTAQVDSAVQYPVNLPKLQAAVVETIGDYVCYMIFTGTVDDMMYEEEAAAIEAYKEANDQAKQIVAGVISGEITVEPWSELDKMRNMVVQYYGTTYYPNVKVHEDEASLGTYLSDVLKMDAAWIDEIIIEVPMISANADMLVLVDTSEGNAENVLNALKAYKTYLVEESLQYPMNEARVKSAVVEQVGDYVCFSILGGAVDDPAAYGLSTDEEIAEYYEMMNMNTVYAMQGYLGIFE